MPFWPRTFLCLDTIHIINSLSLVILSIYLLSSSIVSKLEDCSGFYTNCHQVDIVKRVSILNQHLYRKLLSPSSQTTPVVYDWIGLDQFAIIFSLIVIVIFASISVLNRHRKFVFISILLYLVHLIQLALIEAGDDRDFPENIFRDGYTLARYSILYIDNSLTTLVLKIGFILLILIEFFILIIYFVLLRYEFIYNFHQNCRDNIKSQTANKDVKQTVAA